MELNYCFLPLPLLILLLLSPCVSAAAQDDYRYVNCSKPFTCGDTEAEYPFWGGSRAEYCGRPGFKLECESDQTTITPESSPKFRILELKPEERRMRVAREDLLNNTCFLQIPLSDISTFQFAPGTINLTLNYNCANSLQPQSSLYCNFNGDNVDLFLPVSLGSNQTCRSNFTIPIPEAISSDIMRGNTSFAEALKEGFEVEWDDDAFEELCKNCTYSGGECGFDQAQSQFACFCADQSYSDPRVCSRGEEHFDANAEGIKWGYQVVSMLFPLAVFLMWSNAWLNRELERNVTDKGGCFQQVSSEQNSPQSRPAVVETVQDDSGYVLGLGRQARP